MDIIKKIAELSESNNSFVLATVVNIEGSVPGKIGFKLITKSDGTTFGTIGGGAIEKKVIEESLNRISSRESGTKEYLLSDKLTVVSGDEEVVPMMCSGKVWIYFEVFGATQEVYIFGGGHVGSALLYFLSKLNYYTTLIDNRIEFANKEKNPFAAKIICSDYIEYAKSFNPKPESYFVILTHGHVFDYKILKTICERKIEAKYIGVIGSRTKSAGMIKKLKEELGDDIDLSKLHTPVGLQIGGSTAEEIALSIAAEIQSICFGENKKKW
ncbi:MAG: XdhC/CoxI family protein [bacterium]